MKVRDLSSGFLIGVVGALTALAGDHRTDIIWWNADTRIDIWKQISADAYGNISAASQTVDHADSSIAPELDIADLDGDGKSDLLFEPRDYGLFDLLDGFTIRASAGAFPWAGGTYHIKGFGDANGDGRADIYWRRTDSGEVSVFLSRGIDPKYAPSTILAYMPVTTSPGVSSDWVIQTIMRD